MASTAKQLENDYKNKLYSYHCKSHVCNYSVVDNIMINFLRKCSEWTNHGSIQDVLSQFNSINTGHVSQLAAEMYII